MVRDRDHQKFGFHKHSAIYASLKVGVRKGWNLSNLGFNLCHKAAAKALLSFTATLLRKKKKRCQCCSLKGLGSSKKFFTHGTIHTHLWGDTGLETGVWPKVFSVFTLEFLDRIHVYGLIWNITAQNSECLSIRNIWCPPIKNDCASTKCWDVCTFVHAASTMYGMQ